MGARSLKKGEAMIFDDEKLNEFFSKTEKDEATGCLSWKGALHVRGYPVISLAKYGLGASGQATANRVIYEHFHGELDPQKIVFNSCGNRGCVNVEHMIAGNRSQSYQNSIRFGRMNQPKRNGDKNPMAKLNSESVNEMRELYKAGGNSLRAIGERFGVSPSAVSLIVRHKRWANLSDGGANAEG